MNSAYHAKLMVESKVFETCEHENERFRQEGIVLHKFVWSEVLKSTGARQEAGVKATAAMTGAEYTAVAESMQTTPGKQQKRKAHPKPKAEETEEERFLKVAATERNKAQQKCKNMIDKCLNETHQLRKDVAKLEANNKHFKSSHKNFKSKNSNIYIQKRFIII